MVNAEWIAASLGEFRGVPNGSIDNVYSNFMKFSRLTKNAGILLIGLIGILLFVRPFNFFPFTLFPYILRDTTDAAFNNWILEYNLHAFLSGSLGSLDKWFSPDFFWPEKNVLAWSDNWIFLTPVYSVLRIFLGPRTGFTALEILAILADFLSAYRLSRHGSRSSSIRAIAAFISTFTLTLFAQLGHAQLMTAFFGILSIDSLLGAINSKYTDLDAGKSATANKEASSSWLAFCFFSLAQLATSFYQGIFFAFASFCIILVSLPTIIQGMGLNRKSLSESVNIRTTEKSYPIQRILKSAWHANFKNKIAFTGIVLMIIFNSLVYRYYYFASLVFGRRPWSTVSELIPKAWSYFYNMISSPLLVSLPAPIPQNLPYPSVGEHSMFPGYAYYMLIAIGVITLFDFGSRARHLIVAGDSFNNASSGLSGITIPKKETSDVKVLKVLAKGILLLMIITIGIGGADSTFSLWALFYQFLPGVSALRAVARVGIAMTFCGTPLVAYGLESFYRRSRRAGVSLIAFAFALFALSNVFPNGLGGPDRIHYEKEISSANDSIGKAVKRGSCTAFYIASHNKDPESWIHDQVLAMWVSLDTGIPTVNGYSGQTALGWTPFMTQDELASWLSEKKSEKKAFSMQNQKVCYFKDFQSLLLQVSSINPAGTSASGSLSRSKTS